MSFDGNEYWGLDDTIIGGSSSNAGADDDHTRPESEYLEKRLRSNNRYLIKRNSYATYSFPEPADSAGRKYTWFNRMNEEARFSSRMWDWSKDMIDYSDNVGGGILCLWPMMVSASTRVIRFRMIANINGKTGGSFDTSQERTDLLSSIKVKCVLKPQGQPMSVASSDETFQDVLQIENVVSNDSGWDRWEDDGDSTPQEFNIDVLLTDTELWDSTDYMPMDIALMIRCEKNDGLTVDSASDPSGGVFAWSWKNNETTSTLDLQKLEDDHIVAYNDGGREIYYDVIGVDNQVVTFSYPELSKHPVLLSPNEVTIMESTAITPKSVFIEEYIDPDSAFSTYSPKALTESKPNQTVTGEDVSQTANNVDINFNQPRLKALGPHGNVASTTADESWNANENLKFTYAFLDENDNSTSSGDDFPVDSAVLDQQTLWVDKGPSTIHVMGYFSVIDVGKQHQTGQAQHESFDHYDEEIGPSQQWLITADVDLEIGLELHQFGSGANPIQTDIDDSFQGEQVYMAANNPYSMLLQTQLHGWLSGKDRTTEESEFNKTFKEGMLKDTDTQFLMHINQKIDIPDNSDTDFSRPFMLTLYLNDAEIARERALRTVDISRLVCVCTSTSYTELP